MYPNGIFEFNITRTAIIGWPKPGDKVRRRFQPTDFNALRTCRF
jgi:hypothetical protein